MNKIKLIAIFIIAFAVITTSFSCTSTNDVSSSIPKLCEKITSYGGNGSPGADIQLTAIYPEVPTQLAVYQITTNVDDAWALHKAQMFGLENDQVPLIGDKRQVYSYANNEIVLEIYLDGRIRL